MKFTHYDYKCIYHTPSDDPEKKYNINFFTASNRSEINVNLEYHSSSIAIYSEDKEFEKFNLGVDFSPPDSQLINRCEDRLFLNFIIRGKGRFNGEPFSAGQFYYTLPLQTHTVVTDHDEPFVSVWIAINGMYSQYVVNELNKISQNRFMRLEHRSDVLKLTKLLLYETNLGETSTSYLRSLINIYLSYIKPGNDLDYPEPLYTDNIAKLVRESKIYVRKNLKYVTVADMAAAQNYNVKYFSREFTKAMGMTPLEYITDCRMEWARNSLIHSELSIMEIMETIGYEHRNGFTIAFKKKYGCPPAEYRRKMKKR